jgi:shikimate kinase
MILYLVGISCVGKTTIGEMLAEKLGYSFFDLNIEIERYFNKPIKRIHDEFYSMDEFWEKACVVLNNLFSKENNIVIAGTPAGLMSSYLNPTCSFCPQNQLIFGYFAESCHHKSLKYN